MGRTGRVAITVLVVFVDIARLLPGGSSELPTWAAAVYAVVVAGVMAVGWRSPAAGFVVACAAAALPDGPNLLVVWAAFRAGNRTATRHGAALIGAGAIGYVAGQWLATDEFTLVIAKTMTLVALPMAVGLYLAQQRHLVDALEERNKQLAEQERLQERLRIARDVHDSLGHRLGLVSVQAAALEVGELPEDKHKAVAELARTARQAMDELHELIGTLRRAEDSTGPGLARIDELSDGFRTAGMPLEVRVKGEPRALSGPAGQAAYRVVEEGLTNAARHAPGARVTVMLEWEPDALLLSVTNNLVRLVRLVREERSAAGYGLAGLGERVRLAGGLLQVTPNTSEFRLVAMFPYETRPAEPAKELHNAVRVRRYALGLAVVIMLLLFFPLAGF